MLEGHHFVVFRPGGRGQYARSGSPARSTTSEWYRPTPRGLGKPSNRAPPSWRTAERRPCMGRRARPTRAPKAAPIHWWPRQIPRIGTRPDRLCTRAVEIPASAGVQGPGEITMASGASAAASSSRQPVVADDERLGIEFGEIARDVEDEGIVIVDDQDHAAASLDAVSKAAKMRRTLARVSSYSAAGSDNSVMPPPAWTLASRLRNTTVRIAILVSIAPSKPK